MDKRTYAILGTGALGGFYGAKLQKSGLEVHYLLKSYYQQVRENGLIIESKDGDFVLPQVNAYNDVNKMLQCDVVIISLKTTQNQLLEVVAGAKSTGRIIPKSFIPTMLDYTVKMKSYRTSMKIDFDENRPLELEAIFGNPLKQAAAAGVNLPQIRCLYQQLKFLDMRNRS
ncbi:MAG: hypothetical protein HEQ12_11160 [Aphanizomenon flos-aquae DEX188]|jgi:ketopantoate reductase|nr:MAG: hypothetical protein HEQ12_11160 [Aphanizomenon flos-aquae DEX188]